MNAQSLRKLAAAAVALCVSLAFFAPGADAQKGKKGGGGGGEPATLVAPTIDRVKVGSDDRSVNIRWLPYEGGGDGFQIYTRAEGGSWIDAIRAGAGATEATVSLTPGNTFEVTVAAYTSGRKNSRTPGDQATPVRVYTNGTIADLSVSANGLATWTPYDSLMFDSYDLWFDDCYLRHEPVKNNTLVELTRDCDGVPLVDGQQYSFGVTALQFSDGIGAGAADVYTERFTTTFTYSTGDGGPGEPPPEPEVDELLQVEQVNGRWEIVDTNGNPVVLNGISVRRNGDGSESADFATYDELQAIKSRGFDTIRVVMHWNLFEPTEGQYSTQSFGQLDQLVQDADSIGLNMILDPIHHVDSRYLPEWAWAKSNATPGTASEVMGVIGDNAAPYLEYVMQRYGDYQHFVGVDLVNEVREPSGNSLDAKMTQLMAFYHDLIVEIRSVDPDKPILLQPYYGSTRVTGAQLQRLDDPTAADPQPSPEHFTNIVWTLHDYYSGNWSEFGDGYSSSGYTKFSQINDYGMKTYNSWKDSRLEDGSHNPATCYPGLDADGNCNPSAVDSRRGELRAGMTAHVDVHDSAAQQAGMATLIGEYGLPHVGINSSPVVPGWKGGFRYLEDKHQVYNNLGISRIYWAFDQDIDDTYGLYLVDGTWHYWTDAIFGM